MIEHQASYILVAEDNKPDIYLVRKALLEHGVTYEVRTVNDGEEALRFIADVGSQVPCPKLLLLDLNLPKKTGAEILERLRANPQCANVPVIVMTSSDSPEDRKETDRLGVCSYFRKPTQLESFMELGALVKRVLSERDTHVNT